jgi:hypothetical protein
MNNVITRAHARHDHPPHTVAHEIRRVSLLDRAALHVGIALITWGRRPLSIDTRERRANRVEQRLAQLARERSYERTARLLLRIR